jgi:glycosyltransferase involved in cell wall biosynthesis
MRVVYFTKYSRQGASSRLRSYQYFPKLEQQGIQVSVRPFFNDKYLSKIYAGENPKSEIMKAYIRRFFSLLKVFHYDCIIIEKELFPYFPAWFEWIFKKFKVKFLVDYDDAIFHNYDNHSNLFIRKYLGRKIDRVMEYSSCVIAGNSYLADRAKKAGAQRVEVIPTVIDLERYKNKKQEQLVQKPIIGWIGSPSTFKYVSQIEDVLKKLVTDFEVNIQIIGSGKNRLNFKKNINYIKWEENSEVDDILKFNIGIMPLENTDWEKGKCSYKLIQYMGCSKPVVSSNIGMNKEVIKEGENGFLVNSNQEWYEKLSYYILNPIIASKHGSNGFLTVKQNFNLEMEADKLISILKS